MAGRRRPIVLWPLAWLLVVRFAAGCSFTFIETAPPPEQRGPYFYCHKSKAIPAVDGLVAGWFGVNAVYALSRDDADYAGKTLSPASDVALNVGLALIWAISAGVGSSWVDECRAASDASRRVAPAAASKPAVAPGPIVAPVDPEPIVAPVDPEPIVAPVSP